MEIDEDIKTDIQNNLKSKSPIITEINWLDNGKISFSFEFYPQYKHSIIKYELCYCYINVTDTKWHQYASNHWKTITIGSINCTNNNIELRIATNKAIYDETKNEHIELLMKIRCETKSCDWIHTFYSQFSDIYFIQSMAIPAILNKKTQIYKVFTTIFDNNNNETVKANAIQELISLYEKHKSHFVINKVFTKLLKQRIKKYYQNKCNQLLSSNNNTTNNTNNNNQLLSKYLLEIHKYINYETEHLFPYIKKYCNDDDINQIVSIIVNTAFDLRNNKSGIQHLFENKNIGINKLFIQLICNDQSAMTDLDRLLQYYKYFDETKQVIIQGYFYQSIQHLYTFKTNIKIYEIHNRVLNLIKTKFDNNRMYHKSVECGMNNYLNVQMTTDINNMLQKTVNIDDKLIRQDLTKLYKMYSYMSCGNNKIAENVKIHICLLGNNFIQKSKQVKDAKKSDHELIKNLIDLHDRFLKIVKHEFCNEQIFHKALKEAFEEFINKEYYTSELLARFANDILKKGTKIAILDLENTMDHIIMLYGYIRDKDIFERDYQQYLASRLLQNLSESEQSERLMIGKLKTECGYHWTSKLEDMFKDIQRSKELMVDFRNKYITKCELNVSVCTTGAWPNSYIQPVIQPIDIMDEINKFKQFYVKKYTTQSTLNDDNNNKINQSFIAKMNGKLINNCRRLNFTTYNNGKIMDYFTQNWLNCFFPYGIPQNNCSRTIRFKMDKGKADVSIQFNAKCKKICVVSTYQMMVLLLFNDKTTWTFGEMLQKTGIPKEDLMVAALSMAHPQVGVMRKAPNTKEVENDHKFQINPKYSNPRAKIAIPTLNIKSSKTQQQDGKNMEAIYRLRRHQMDAAIVRIMKARKTLKHPDLVTEIIRQLRGRFTPKPVDIKKRIANLIELEYLERDENDRQLYHYKM